MLAHGDDMYRLCVVLCSACLARSPGSSGTDSNPQTGTSGSTSSDAGAAVRIIADTNVADTMIADPSITDSTAPAYTETSKAEEILGKLISLPGGTFLMGSTKADFGGNPTEWPQHEVTLSPFTLMEREVTQETYEYVLGKSSSTSDDCPACPVTFVSWNDAVAFAEAVSAATGEDWRLLTEAEWEYAARGGESHLWSGSDDPDEVAWTQDNSGLALHLGCELAKNAYGLCDMSGNVGEWVADWYGLYEEGAVVDPTGPAKGTNRVYRSGSYSNFPITARVTGTRLYNGPGAAIDNVGFRLARSDP